jgi:hypothetical protein
VCAVGAEKLFSLPDDVRRSARIHANGEVSWPIESAAVAIDALAEASFVVLGLDVRRTDDDDGARETAWSSFEPGGLDHDHDVRAGRDAALEALSRPDVREFGDWILVTWR